MKQKRFVGMMEAKLRDMFYIACAVCFALGMFVASVIFMTIGVAG